MKTCRWVILCALGACSAPTSPAANLNDASSDPVVRLVDDGRVRGATFRVPAMGATAASSADVFLDTFGDALGVPSRAGALTQLEVQDAPNSDAEIVVYEGTQDGHPVFGSEYRVRVEDGEVTYAGGSIVDDPTESLGEPTLTMEEAVASASAEMGRTLRLDEGSLVALNIGLLVGRTTPSVLTWMVDVYGLERWTPSRVFVSAISGEVVFELPLYALEREREVLSYGGLTLDDIDPEDAELQITENDPQPEVEEVTAPAMDIFGNMGRYYDFLSESHDRDSIDDAGLLLRAHVDIDYANAHWSNRNLATFHGPGRTSLDTVTHEFTHGMIHFTAKLVYKFESGAINESICDVYTAFITDGASWAYADDRPSGALRSFSDPASIRNQPDHVNLQGRDGSLDLCSPGAACADSSESCLGGICVDTSRDHGRVHSNSSIVNQAIWLMSQGGTNRTSDIAVEGIGVEKVRELVYSSLTEYLGKTSRFIDYRFAMRASAIEWIEATEEDEEAPLGGFTYEECGSVLNAFGAVGIGSLDGDNDCFADDVDNCPCTYNPEQNDDDCDGEEDPAMCVEDTCVTIDTCDVCDATEGCGYCDGGCRSEDNELGCSSRLFDVACDEVLCNGDTCGGCVDVAGCAWCNESCQNAAQTCLNTDGEIIDPSTECEDPCSDFDGCGLCVNEAGCAWDGSACVTMDGRPGLINREAGCYDCTIHTGCEPCAEDGFCSWCAGRGACVNDYQLDMCFDVISTPLEC